MATRNELLTLFKAAMLPSSNANFSAEDANSAAINAIVETYGLQKASVREIRARQNEVFSIIEEAVDELLRCFAYLLNIFFRYAFLAVHEIIGKLVNARNSFGAYLLVDR